MTPKSLLRRLFAALGLSFLLAAAPAAGQAQATARPALWAVSDADTTIYLFGTIHLLPPNLQWETPTFRKAEATAQSLVIETIVDPKNPKPYFDAVLKLGFAQGLPPIADRVPRGKRSALLAAIAKSGIPANRFDQMKTWTAAVTLLQLQFLQMGLQGKEGPETILRQEFTAAGKPIEQLETIGEQFGFFDRLPEAAQRQLLEGALEPVDEAKTEFNQMLSAWEAGDVKGIANSFNHDLSGAPEVQSALIHQRNANWSKWIEQRMAQPGTIMVAVGAGHLAGKDSVIELLKKGGLRVRRLQ